MAHSLSAQKRIRQAEKRRARNRWRKDQIKSQTKIVLGAIQKGDASTAEVELNKLVSRLDQVASKNTIHKNAAARKRSRMTRKLNAIKAGKGKTAATA